MPLVMFHSPGGAVNLLHPFKCVTGMKICTLLKEYSTVIACFPVFGSCRCQ